MVCESLHLPVQTGSDSMLRRMGRQYTIAHYGERLARIREAVPGIALSTDVIVGFCGETEAEYEATLGLLRAVRFDQVFAAAYSERPGTPATRLADDVPAAVKHAASSTCSGSRRRSGSSATAPGWGARPRSSWTPSCRRGPTTTTTTTRRPRAPPSHATPSRACPKAIVHLAGRSRENKLVHVAGTPALLGDAGRGTIEHAGPYALRGRLA